MIKYIIFIVSVISLVFNLNWAWAHSEEAAICIKTYEPIVVDGNLDDWVKKLESSNWGAMLDVKKGKTEMWMKAVPNYLNKLSARVEAGEVKESEDYSMVFYTMWDDKNFYFAAIVNDREIVTQHEGENIWQDDCVELWFDTRHDAISHTMMQDDEYQIGLSPKSKYRDKTLAWVWRNPKSEITMSSVKLASSLTETGYIIEAAIPFSALTGIKPKAGSYIGFNVTGVDKDDDEVWSHITWSGTLHSDPTQFGDLYFLDSPLIVFTKDLINASE